MGSLGRCGGCTGPRPATGHWLSLPCWARLVSTQALSPGSGIVGMVPASTTPFFPVTVVRVYSYPCCKIEGGTPRALEEASCTGSPRAASSCRRKQEELGLVALPPIIRFMTSGKAPSLSFLICFICNIGINDSTYSHRDVVGI